MVNSSHVEERYSRMHSFCRLVATTCWKACHIPLLFAHLRVCREWSLWCCFFKVWHTGWNTFLTAPMTQLISFRHVHFDIPRCTSTKMRQLFLWRTQTRPVSHGIAQGFQEDQNRSPCLSRRKPSCLHCVPPICTRQEHMARRSAVILMGAH